VPPPASSVGAIYYMFVEMDDVPSGIANRTIFPARASRALVMASPASIPCALAIANPPELSPLYVTLTLLIYDASPSNR